MNHRLMNHTFRWEKAVGLLTLLVTLILVGNSLGNGTFTAPPGGQSPDTSSTSDSKLAEGFIFVPFPCPSLKYYQQAQAFIDQICAAASGAHVKVIIVRSCYNDAANLASINWWGDQIRDLPNHYKQFIDDGTVKLVDQYPGLNLHATPCGFFNQDGKTVWTGILTVDDPAKALDLITKKTADTLPPAIATPISH